MQPQVTSRPETTNQVIALARFVILCSLALTAILLVADFAGRGWSTPDARFLSQQVIITFVYAIASQVIAAIAAITCLTLWKS
jgi:hypothetical protein